MTVLHVGPILLTSEGTFAFQTFCPAEGEACTHTYKTRSQAATERGTMRRGIEMAGGAFTAHPDSRSFARILKEARS